ncbi:hypothetical protein ACFY8C_09555 [Streptomyces flavochromogenes]|uniref:Lipoprotein n=1 Tax=Streptomyces flavochromogenes TaxID=68199 RepID=A0ABW6XM84_9ACTN|nr:hypothetical protein [Streptomyces flavochromogenes]
MVRGVRVTWCGTLLLVGVLVGGASGCGPETPPAPGGPPSELSGPAEPAATTTAPGATATPGVTTVPGTTAAPGTPTADPHPAEVLVEVVVNGGLAGVRNKLVVHYDGSWTSRSGTKAPRTGRQTPAEAAELRAALEDPAYARVPERPTGGPVFDGFQYYVTYRHRLVVSGDGERPAALQRVFAALPEGGPPTNP